MEDVEVRSFIFLGHLRTKFYTSSASHSLFSPSQQNLSIQTQGRVKAPFVYR